MKTLRTLAATTILCSVAWSGAAAQERLVVFGDSLADGGFFSTVVPGLSQDAASFTTNPDPVAPEVFASGIGAPVPDIAYAPGGAPTAPGTNFAIGGARVTEPNASGQVPLSISEQIDVFLATRSFEAGDVVYIQGGGNDFFEFGRQAGLGNFDTTIVTDAAAALAAQVARLEAAGAPLIVTQSIQNDPTDPQQDGLRSFNDAYEAALAAQGANVIYFDTETLSTEILLDATQQGGATFGITNVTDLACASGSSLGCTPAQYVTPDANETFLLADGAHFTGRFNEIQGQAIASVVQAPQSFAGLVFGTQAAFRAQSQLMRGDVLPGGGGDGTAAFAPGGGEGWSVFGGIGAHGYDGSGVDQSAGTIAVGLDYAFGPGASAGLAVAGSEGTGDFDAGGGYDLTAYSVQGYVRGQAELGAPVRWNASLQWGGADLGDVARTFALGPSVRSQVGDTEATFFAVRAEAAFDVFEAGGFTLGPLVGLRYEDTDVDGYADASFGVLTISSTNVSFGDAALDGFTTVLGVQAHGAVGAADISASIAWEHAFDDDVSVSATPTGAPVASRRSFGRDEDVLAFDVDASFAASERVTVTGGLSGKLGGDTFVAADLRAALRF